MTKTTKLPREVDDVLPSVTPSRKIASGYNSLLILLILKVLLAGYTPGKYCLIAGKNEKTHLLQPYETSAYI